MLVAGHAGRLSRTDLVGPSWQVVRIADRCFPACFQAVRPGLAQGLPRNPMTGEHGAPNPDELSPPRRSPGGGAFVLSASARRDRGRAAGLGRRQVCATHDTPIEAREHPVWRARFRDNGVATLCPSRTRDASGRPHLLRQGPDSPGFSSTPTGGTVLSSVSTGRASADRWSGLGLDGRTAGGCPMTGARARSRSATASWR